MCLHVANLPIFNRKVIIFNTRIIVIVTTRIITYAVTFKASSIFKGEKRKDLLRCQNLFVCVESRARDLSQFEKI